MSVTHRYVFVAIALATGIAASACNEEPAYPFACTPGTTAACVCAGGGTGTASCDSTTSTWGACSCASTDGSDTSPDPDVSGDASEDTTVSFDTGTDDSGSMDTNLEDTWAADTGSDDTWSADTSDTTGRACDNESDYAIISSPDLEPETTGEQNVATIAQSCGLGCVGAGNPSECSQGCIAEQSGLSNECSACVGDVVECTLTSCFSQCLAPDSTECYECQYEMCAGPFQECAGIDLGF